MPVISATPTNPAAEFDLVIKQGTDVDIVVTVEDESGARNLGGYSARMHVREFVDSDDTLLEFTSGANNLVVSGSTVTIKVSKDMTTGVDWSAGVYDLEIVSGTGRVECIMEGAFYIKPEVTR